MAACPRNPFSACVELVLEAICFKVLLDKNAIKSPKISAVNSNAITRTEPFLFCRWGGVIECKLQIQATRRYTLELIRKSGFIGSKFGGEDYLSSAGFRRSMTCSDQPKERTRKRGRRNA